MKYMIIFLMLINLFSYISYRKVLVAVTLEPLASIVYEIGGGLIEVEVLLPEGVEPHTFQLTRDVIETASRADLIVHTGHMEWEKELVS
ncbi:MAG: ABC transporter substrate-binding protein, partial [Thermoprotei archaeon]